MIHNLLEKAATDFPHKEAVVCGSRRFLYKELEEAANKLARFLSDNGVNSGDRIGIFSNKIAEEIIAIFAILKINCVFVQINPQFLENHLSHVISNCDIRILFVSNAKTKILERAYKKKCPIKLIISLSAEIDLNRHAFRKVVCLGDILKKSSKSTKVPSDSDNNDIASIIYTSGSTGMPKGIIVTNNILYTSTVASTEVLGNRHDDRLISTAPFAFDGALSQLLTMFFVGGTIVLQHSNFPKDIVNTLIQEKITGFHAVPSLWIMLLQNYSPFSKNEYPQLRYISFIGESFPERYLGKLKKILGNTRIYAMYGTTEAFRSTYLPPEDLEKKPQSIGKPFPGVNVTIVDKQNNICPTGEIGEIVHKGVFISPGYWNDEEHTKETFKNGSLYTGDLGKMDKEGYLYFVGRMDGMIKTSGYRVSPEEIERCIYQIEGIKETVVLGVPDDEVGNKVKVIAVCKDGVTLKPREIINHCRSRLPNYMVPGIVQFQEKLPKTATNKVNRSELN
ncbi:MAG: AMP-binding protein [Thermodesulfobacteriota bacterium]|nr:MAG: AMP-binding protein [Thermodesulfobacteriota bacterium]